MREMVRDKKNLGHTSDSLPRFGGLQLALLKYIQNGWRGGLHGGIFFSFRFLTNHLNLWSFSPFVFEPIGNE
jgi:hypothetical protein